MFVPCDIRICQAFEIMHSRSTILIRLVVPTKTRLFFLKNKRCSGIESNEFQYNYNEKTQAPCWHDNANMVLF